MAIVRIPTVLRPHTGGQARVDVAGETVGDVLAALVEGNPALGERLLEDGRVRGYVNVFVDDEDIRYLDGEATVIPAGVEVSIMPAVAGGSH
jgi:molybdopterin synthase sulfur carrier subunit